MTEGDGPGPGLTSQQGSSGQGRSRVGVRGGNERKGRCAAPALSGSEGAQARAEGRSRGARGTSLPSAQTSGLLSPKLLQTTT